MKVLFGLFSLLILLCTGYDSVAQLTVTNGISPQALVQSLLGTGITASNIVYTGAPLASGTFNGSNSNIGLSSGVLLTSGTVDIAPGPNANGGAGTDNQLPGYGLLDVLSGVSTFDAAVLEFDFLPMADSIRFRYVFASEEYDEFVCGTVNDVFAFFISGPGIVGEQNLAIIPGTTTAVSINTLNNGSCGGGFSFHTGCDLSHAAYFIDNPNGSTVEYDGFTTVLTAQTVVIPCVTYHIKLAIADGGDHVYDSGVFLEAGSFTGVNPISAVAQTTSGVLTSAGTYGCAPFLATFQNTSTGTNQFFWDFGDGSPFDTTSNPGHIYQHGGNYNVLLIANDTTACNFSDTAHFTLFVDSGLVHASFNLIETDFCDSIRADVTATGYGAQSYAWNFGDGGVDTGAFTSHVYNSPGTYFLYHISTDTLCHISDSVASPVVVREKLHSAISTSSVEGCSPFGLVMCYGGNASVSSRFDWDFGNGAVSTSLCDSAYYNVAGTYHARLIITDTTFCNRLDTSYISVHVKVKPEAAFILPDSQNVLEPLTPANVSINARRYNWDFGDGGYATGMSPEHQYTIPGIYKIYLTAYEDICKDTVSHKIKVYENPQAIWFPAGFSPNGDGSNDLFIAYGIGIVDFTMIIYNRWGMKLFESEKITDGWDGQVNGRPAENGVYIYFIKATLLNHEEVEKYGTVTVSK